MPTTTRLLYEAFSHVAIIQRTLLVFTHTSPCTVYTQVHSFIQLSELGHLGENENVKASKKQQRGFEPAGSRLRARYSTAEQPRSTKNTTKTRIRNEKIAKRMGLCQKTRRITFAKRVLLNRCPPNTLSVESLIHGARSTSYMSCLTRPNHAQV